MNDTSSGGLFWSVQQQLQQRHIVTLDNMRWRWRIANVSHFSITDRSSGASSLLAGGRLRIFRCQPLRLQQ